MKIAVSGSHGLIGSALVKYFLAKGHSVYRFSGRFEKGDENEIFYHPDDGIVDDAALEGVDAVIHLAGESITGFWTDQKKSKIRQSRIKGTALLARAIGNLRHPPSVFISASAVGFYGDRGKEPLAESSPKGSGFLAEVCSEWEEAAKMHLPQQVRLVNLRIGMVLSPQGGILKRLLPIFKLGLGGKMGSGEQIVSWISLEDLIGAIDFCLEKTAIQGPLNAVSPHAVTHAEMIRLIAQSVHRPAFFSLSPFFVRLIFGQLGREVFLSSTNAIPEKLKLAGYRFQFPSLCDYFARMSDRSSCTHL